MAFESFDPVPGRIKAPEVVYTAGSSTSNATVQIKPPVGRKWQILWISAVWTAGSFANPFIAIQATPNGGTNFYDMQVNNSGATTRGTGTSISGDSPIILDDQNFLRIDFAGADTSGTGHYVAIARVL